MYFLYVVPLLTEGPAGSKHYLRKQVLIITGKGTPMSLDLY